MTDADSAVPELPPLSGRQDPPYVAPEREMLDAWLEFHRATLLGKCEGLTDDQLRRRSVPPSSLSLLGLVRHLTEVERTWFRHVFQGEDTDALYSTSADWDADFNGVDDADAAADVKAFQWELTACRAVTAQHPDLDAVSRGKRHGHRVSLRWVYLHMIEEYARHNGHADLLRECVDGVTGD